MRLKHAATPIESQGAGPTTTRACGTAYEAASRSAANVRMDTHSLMECHHALIATRRIAQGEEIHWSYGRHYWLSRLVPRKDEL